MLFCWQVHVPQQWLNTHWCFSTEKKMVTRSATKLRFTNIVSFFHISDRTAKHSKPNDEQPSWTHFWSVSFVSNILCFSFLNDLIFVFALCWEKFVLILTMPELQVVILHFQRRSVPGHIILWIYIFMWLRWIDVKHSPRRPHFNPRPV
jgi:hypothetical protein